MIVHFELRQHFIEKIVIQQMNLSNILLITLYEGGL